MQSFYNKVYLLRFDLHLPKTDTPISDAEGKTLISAFFKSIKEKLNTKQEGSLSNVTYQWAYEVENEKKGHYHCWIAVDGNKRQKPGSTKNKTGLIGIVIREWEKLSSGTVRLAGEHQEHQGHKLRRGDEKAKDACIRHISYLAKVRSKGYGGKRKGSSNYGTSRLKAKVIH
jgi:hypothetical protein